jgi:hypothetical protein
VPNEILIEAILKNKFAVQKAFSVVLEQDNMQKLDISKTAVSTGKIAKDELQCQLGVIPPKVVSFDLYQIIIFFKLLYS